ncbi:MAG: hypothetical protein AMXMBFR33_57040 [Candidatus Xenobia bacterium]
MNEVLTGLVILVVGGLATLFLNHRWVALVTAAAGFLTILEGSGQVLALQTPQSLELPWAVPGGSFSLLLDPLAAFFLVPAALLGILASVYAVGYFPRPGRRSTWFFLHLMMAALGLVLLARNGVLFLVAWEVMALASFFLVTSEDEQRQVRQAGWIYLVATHLGSFFLIAFFAITPDFGQSGVGPVAFALGLIGFGSKAGLVPLHIWLPEAHPVAPSPVSALLSGVVINTGIYGLMRALSHPPEHARAIGWTLLLVGAITALTGVLFALAQRDLKGLLAYSSVENMGLVCLGLGLGLLGQPLATAAAMLHLLSHGVLKSLLFLAAGSVLHQTHTRDLEEMGGLLRRMPRTGLAFLVGAAGLAGLPPLGGFITELLLLLCAVQAMQHNVLAGLVTLLTVALVAGLALAAFTKAFGIAFLGEPRSQRAAHAHDPGPLMLTPMALLALAALGLAAGTPWLLSSTYPEQAAVLASLLSFTGLVVALAAALYALRSQLLKTRPVGAAPTWDCGYLAPSARMEYTGLSFTQPLTDLFASVLHHRVRQPRMEPIFPAEESFSDETPDLFEDEVYRPMLEGLERLSGLLRRLQHGRVQLYVLYVLITLVGLLAWGQL